METDVAINSYSLDYVVRACLADIDEPDTSPLYIKMLKWANDGYRRLNLAGLMPITFKSSYFDVDIATNTFELPNNYMYYLKIGLCHGGHIINLVADDNICLRPFDIEACECDEQVIRDRFNYACACIDSGSLEVGDNTNTGVQQDNSWFNLTWYYPYYQHWHNGQFTAGYYGRGAGFYGNGFKVNLEANRVQLDSCLRVERVFMEYASSGLNVTGDSIVPQTALPALQAFVHKQRCAFSRERIDMQQYPTFANLFRVEQRAMNSRQQAMTASEWYNMFRNLTYQTPKR